MKWEVPDGVLQSLVIFFELTISLEASERAFRIGRAQISAQYIISNGTVGGQGDRGQRRGGCGGRGRGRGGGRGESSAEKGVNNEPTTEVGEKRKRAVEPDGGSDTKGQDVSIIRTSRKAKLHEGVSGGSYHSNVDFACLASSSIRCMCMFCRTAVIICNRNYLIKAAVIPWHISKAELCTYNL